jgi:hypothetical protein
MISLIIIAYILIGFGTYCFIIYDDYAREMRSFNKYGTKKSDVQDIVERNMPYVLLILIWPVFWILYVSAYIAAGVGFLAIMTVETIYNMFYKPKD